VRQSPYSLKDSLSFVPSLFVLGSRIGLQGDPAAHGELPPTSSRYDRSYQNIQIKTAIPAEVAERATVGASCGRLELGDDLHGSNFRRPSDRPSRERTTQEVECDPVRLKLAPHNGDQVLYVLVGFQPAELSHLEAIGPTNSGEVIPQQIDDHHVFCPVFVAFEQIIRGQKVCFGGRDPPPCTLDRTCFDLANGAGLQRRSRK
jgi:hypothetical protein